MKAVLIDTMGDDLKIVNAARASFGSKSGWEYADDPEGTVPLQVLSKKDANLIKYLARGLPSAEMDSIIDCVIGHTPSDVDTPNDCREVVRAALNRYRGVSTHWVPFAHCQLTFEVEMPIFVARQLIRHTVGVAISEMSRRYVGEDPDYWTPGAKGWRLRADNVKQGSSDECLLGTLGNEDLGPGNEVEDKVLLFCDKATELYRELVDVHKVAPELARMILPQNTYTSWTWTISLVTAARVCKQRLDPHAQKEIQVLAQQVQDAASKSFPVAFKALMDYGA